jgi:predicted nucleic acid-binding protein
MSEPSSRQFVDTNILVYAHDASAGQKQSRAAHLIRDLWQSGEGCLSVQVLQEFYVTVTQKVAKPLAPEAAAQVIADLSVWHVHRPGVQDVLDAIRVQERYHTSFWDAMIIASALRLGCKEIWSEDLNPGQVYGELRVIDPF